MVDGPSAARGDWPINIHHIAEELGVPEETVREWTQRADFPHRSGMDEAGPLWHIDRVQVWLDSEEGQAALAESRQEHSNS